MSVVDGNLPDPHGHWKKTSVLAVIFNKPFYKPFFQSLYLACFRNNHQMTHTYEKRVLQQGGLQYELVTLNWPCADRMMMNQLESYRGLLAHL